METILHILTQKNDSLATDINAGQQQQSGLTVQTFDLTQPQPDYARLLDMVVTTATLADFTAPLPITHETVPSGTTTPPAASAVKEVFVGSHRYGSVTLPEIQAPVLRVTLELMFDLEEV